MSFATFPFLLISLSWPLQAQEATAGIAVPFTVTGGVFHDSDGDTSASYRAVFYPTLKLGPKWFVYSAIQVGSQPYAYPAAYEQKGNVQVRALQAFLGRTWTAQNFSVTFKAGQLASAFGSFPLRYDDMANPLIDQPIPYVSALKISPGQLPCGVSDLARQWASDQGGILFGCGGDITKDEGIYPTTLYGLPGAEVDISTGKVDARFQLTNSSPANPQSLISGNQQLQWAAGAGYTVRQGFRVGLSAFRGPYLDRNIRKLRNYPATGIGADLQWARGRFSAEAEWQRFQFDYPQFVTSPAVSFGYVELKAILTPRVYAATRLGYQKYSAVQDQTMTSSDPFLSGRRSYEFALGYRPNRWQLFKIEYQRLRVEGEQTFDTILAFQLVTSVQSLSKTLR
jgi:hypothetical protein